jgi:hypothetical protein
MTQGYLSNTPLISNDTGTKVPEASVGEPNGSTPLSLESTMQTQGTDKPFISEPLTWQQICERYPDEWVCLVEIDRPEDNNFAFRTARVVGHGKGRRDPYLQARAFYDQYNHMGHYFTGRARRFFRWALLLIGEEAPDIDAETPLTAQGDVIQPPVLSEPLTWREICKRYPDEWVCLVEIDAFNDNDFGFRSARVVGHGKDPRDPYVQARLLGGRYEEMGHYFTGLARGPFPRFC